MKKSSKIIMLLSLIVSTQSFATTPIKLKLALNWKAEPQFGGFYEAFYNGEFIKRGLDVEILEGGSGSPTVQMLGAKKVNFAIVSAEEIVIAQDRGSKIVGLFAAFQTNPQAIMTHLERHFRSLSDVFAAEGILSIQSGLSYAQYLLKKYPRPKVKIVPYLGGITNFTSDSKLSQQCFFTSEPLIAEKSGLKVKTFLVSDEGFNPYTVVVATSAESLKQDAKTAKAFIGAVRAGWDTYLKNPKPTNELMAGINKSMSSETFAKSSAAQMTLIQTAETYQKGLGFMSEERWHKLVLQLKELKSIKKEIPPGDLFKNL